MRFCPHIPMGVSVCVCARACIITFSGIIYIYIYTCMYVCICVCVCIYIYMYVCVRVYITHVYIYTYIHTVTCMYTCVCVWYCVQLCISYMIYVSYNYSTSLPFSPSMCLFAHVTYQGDHMKLWVSRNITPTASIDTPTLFGWSTFSDHIALPFLIVWRALWWISCVCISYDS